MIDHLEHSVPSPELDRFYRIAGLYYLDRYAQVLGELDRELDDLFVHAPLRPWLLRFRAYSRFKVGELALALRDLALLEALTPDDGWAKQGREAIVDDVEETLRSLGERKMWRELETLADATLAAFGAWPQVEWQKAVALDELGRSAEAEVLLRDLVERTPLVEPYWRSLTLVVAHQRRFEAARDVGHEAVRVLLSGGRPTESFDDMFGWIDQLEATVDRADDTSQLMLLN